MFFSHRDCLHATNISELHPSTEAELASTYQFRFYCDTNSYGISKHLPVATLFMHTQRKPHGEDQTSGIGLVELHFGDCVHKVELCVNKESEKPVTVKLHFGTDKHIVSSFTSAREADKNDCVAAAECMINPAFPTGSTSETPQTKVPGEFYRVECPHDTESDGTTSVAWERKPRDQSGDLSVLLRQLGHWYYYY